MLLGSIWESATSLGMNYTFFKHVALTVIHNNIKTPSVSDVVFS